MSLRLFALSLVPLLLDRRAVAYRQGRRLRDRRNEVQPLDLRILLEQYGLLFAATRRARGDLILFADRMKGPLCGSCLNSVSPQTRRQACNTAEEVHPSPYRTDDVACRDLAGLHSKQCSCGDCWPEKSYHARSTGWAHDLSFEVARWSSSPPTVMRCSLFAPSRHLYFDACRQGHAAGRA